MTKNPASTTENSRKMLDKNRGVRQEKGGNTRQKTLLYGCLFFFVFVMMGGSGGYLLFQHIGQTQQHQQAWENQFHQLAQEVQGLRSSSERLTQFSEQIAQLTHDKQVDSSQLMALKTEIQIQKQAINALQVQINRLNSDKTLDSGAWQLTEAHGLLRLAQQQLWLNGSLPTIIALLQQAEKRLATIDSANVLAVRRALADDLHNLTAVKPVDENALIQQLSSLSEQVSHLTPLTLSHHVKDETLSQSITDWQSNLKKSAQAFLNQFIRVIPKNVASPALLAPDQILFLHENIRLRLQIALLAVSRHQNDLYHQSLTMIEQWIKDYFDTQSPQEQAFLASLQHLQNENVAKPFSQTLKSLPLMDSVLSTEKHSE